MNTNFVVEPYTAMSKRQKRSLQGAQFVVLQSVSRQSGAALIFAILVALLLGVFAGFFTFKAKQNIELAEGVQAQLLARRVADNAVNKAIFSIASMTYAVMDWPRTVDKSTKSVVDKVVPNAVPTRAWGFEHNVSDSVTVSFQELGAKLSIIPLNRQEWVNVLQVYGLDMIAAQGVVDKIEDWMDSDSFRRIQGLEKRGYQFNNQAVYPRNWFMQSTDELEFIPGLDSRLRQRIAHEITYWGGSDRAPMAGSPAMIAAYAGADAVARVAELRAQDGSIRQIYNSLQNVDASVVNDIPSGLFRIEIVVKTEQAKFTRVVDVNFKETDVIPFYFMDWR